MKKQVFSRGLLGFPLGITIGYVITIVLSLGWGQGSYSPCVPELIDTMGSEIGAVVFQAVLCGILGAAFSACSMIWEMESWSIARQSCIYFLITSFVMMPIAYFSNWMPHTLPGFLSYFGIFVLIFVVAWVVQYFIWRDKINKINAGVDEKRRDL